MYAITLDEARYRLTKLWADRKVHEEYSVGLHQMLMAQVIKNVAKAGLYEQYASPEFLNSKKERRS